MKATLTVGIPGSGKTTWSEEYCRKNNAVNINRDDIRFSISGTRNWSQYKFKGETENMVTAIQTSIAKEAVDKRKEIVISDTNLSQKTREYWERFFKKVGYAIEYKTFHISLEEAWKRDSVRENGVGRDVLQRMHKNYLKWVERKTYVPDVSLPEAIIVDVDGTVADMEGIRTPFEWEKVHLDKPRDIIISMVQGLRGSGKKVIFLSGRDGVCKEATAKWLTENVGHYDEFFIRTAGDMRKDTVIKEELFWKEIAHKYNVVAAIDDRPCVVRLWHEIGIKNVIAVADQNIEF